MEEKVLMKYGSLKGIAILLTFLLLIVLPVIVGAISSRVAPYDLIPVVAGLVGVCLVAGVITLIVLLLRSFELVITDKYIRTRLLFGRRVYIPVDSICAVGCWWPLGITIVSARGRIALGFVGKRDEICNCVLGLINERSK